MGSLLDGVLDEEKPIHLLHTSICDFLLDNVKDVRVLLFTYYNRPILNATWTGDTHEETDILPSSRRDEDS